MLEGGGPVFIHTDSRYVQGMIAGKFKPRENINLCLLVRHLFTWARAALNIKLRWVKGHSGVRGNEIADHFAGEGSDIIKQHWWWARP